MLPDWHAHGVLFLFIAVPRPEGTDGHLRSTIFASRPGAQNDVRSHVERRQHKIKVAKDLHFDRKAGQLTPESPCLRFNRRGQREK